MSIVTTAEDCILSTPQTSGLQAGTITNYTTGAVELTQHYVPPSSLNSTGLSTTPSVIRLLWPLNSLGVLLLHFTKDRNSL